ncbi:enoyl-CoA hydratase/isomerase family protein [Hyphomicrobium sp. CS1BSMeth3]|uniref:enoyl-CoA hydratase/isomerase family protein n=1 Tax=Hyphomicrobium sp. CS1BSMeth3 TaxID=1892844 RepID=UPI00092FEFEC|nr:enoyl-CoA hydratase/isomerase family protein [Hyphomicrobium sp. CS1BSMeth3]
MAELVLKEMRGPVQIVTLNRPAVLNAVSPELRAAFTAAMKEAEADATVGAVVITGAGKAFSAGQDLNETANLTIDQVRGWCTSMRVMYQSVRDLSKPAVAAWNGIAAGAGMQIGLCCDVRVAHPAARIGQPETRAGLASIVGTYLMGLYVGHGPNRELSLSGGLVGGERAHAIGLVDHLVPEGEVLTKALAIAEDLLKVPPVAMQLTKERFRTTTQPGFDDATAAGVRYSLEAYATGEPQRIMKGFIAARAQRKK